MDACMKRIAEATTDDDLIELRRVQRVAMIKYKDLERNELGRGVAFTNTVTGDVRFEVFLDIDSIRDEVGADDDAFRDLIHEVVPHEHTHSIMYPTDATGPPPEHDKLSRRLETATGECD